MFLSPARADSRYTSSGMPRHLSAALDTIAAWPKLDGRVYSSWLNREGHVPLPAGSDAVVEYMRSISAWPRFGFTIDNADRADIRNLWKHRPDLRYVLEDTIGFYVCDELQRPFLRNVLAGGRGDVAAWTAAYPDLRQPLLAHLRDQARRYNRPFEAVRACLTLTRELGEPPEVWRDAALAINWDDRRQAKLPQPRRSDFLRHDLETHGTITQAEGESINLYLVELRAVPLNVMVYGAWWHPAALPGGELLRRVADASHAFAGPRWSDRDAQTYARALAALPKDQVAGFVADSPHLRRIAELARAL